MANTGEYFGVVRRHLRGVPHRQHETVCSRCLGPKSDAYGQCVGCLHLFVRNGASWLEDVHVVPVTVAENPGAWYSHLIGYKGVRPELRATVVSVYWSWFAHFQSEITATLGGPPDGIVVTPSKRGVAPAAQPLRRTMAMVAALPPLVNGLRFRDGATLPRHGFDPTVFEATPAAIDGKRLLLVEDTWVTGSTAMSAAGALRAAGAEVVLVSPIARLYDPRASERFLGSDHPYPRLIAIPPERSFLAWPR